MFSPLFFPGNLCMVTGGANLGRIGVITNRERHPGSFDVVHVKDSTGNSFATRLSNIFVIGKVRTHSSTFNLKCLFKHSQVILSETDFSAYWSKDDSMKFW